MPLKNTSRMFRNDVAKEIQRIERENWSNMDFKKIAHLISGAIFLKSMLLQFSLSMRWISLATSLRNMREVFLRGRFTRAVSTSVEAVTRSLYDCGHGDSLQQQKRVPMLTPSAPSARA